MSDLQKWIRIRKELYRHVREQVRHRVGENTADLRRYQKSYDREFDGVWTPVQRDDLLESLAKARVVLLSDFHALQQSQKAQLRILKNITFKKTPIIFVECIEADSQAVLDDYMQGRISEKEFLQEVRWQQKWGFPWEHYRPLFRFAQQKKIPIRGLNLKTNQRTGKSLQKRDQFAAKEVARAIEENPQRQIFVIYGELHMAKQHLPGLIARYAKIKKNSQEMITVFQNSEKIYFQMLEQGVETTVDIVQLKPYQFCMISVPPWVKWQNYLMYLEKTYDSGLSEDDNQMDYTDHVSAYVRLIVEELGLKVNTSQLSVYTSGDANLWQRIEEQYSLDEKKMIKFMIEDEMSFYLPEIQLAYLARPTVNHAAELAMQFVYFSYAEIQEPCLKFPHHFVSRIWIEGISYFGSKIINHKRKADTIADLKASLASRSSSRQGRDEMMLALAQKMEELMIISGQSRREKNFKPKKKSAYLLAAQILGGMLGERLYHGYHKRLLSLVSLRHLLKKNPAEKGFSTVYYEAMEIVESLPSPFRSKKEKM